MRVGICGLGTVGSGLFNLLADNQQETDRKTSSSIRLVQVGCRRDHPDCDLTSVQVTRDIFDVARNPEVDLLVELIGGTDTARSLVLEAISQGKQVVTANKALIALHGEEIFAAARERGVSVRYEAAIAGGIPVVKAIREGLAGNRIDWLAGIINGTANYILSEMGTSDRSFAEALQEAQKLGYAEADPTFDVEGMDAAHKLTILASIAFGVPLRFDAVQTEGISEISPDDIHFAAELGYCIKHLGIARRVEGGGMEGGGLKGGGSVELRVHPTLVSADGMLAQVNGVMNAVLVNANAAGATLYYGAGAGAGPTASAVMADIIDAARGFVLPDLGYESLSETAMLPPSSAQASFYLRLGVEDKPGVMADVSTVLSNHDVSIEALIQKDARVSDAQIVMVTSEVQEAQMDLAISDLESLAAVTRKVARIRVAGF